MRWVRPLLLVALMLGVFSSTTWFTYQRIITAEVYLATWTPILSLMVGYLFGERSALKRPGQNYD